MPFIGEILFLAQSHYLLVFSLFMTQSSQGHVFRIISPSVSISYVTIFPAEAERSQIWDLPELQSKFKTFIMFSGLVVTAEMSTLVTIPS